MYPKEAGELQTLSDRERRIGVALTCTAPTSLLEPTLRRQTYLARMIVLVDLLVCTLKVERQNLGK